MFAVGHLALGYLTGKATSKLLNVEINVPLLFLFSILPDIDLMLGITHRGPTHSIIVFAVALVPALLLFRKGVVPLFAALAQHSLLGDFLTGGGIQILWPVSYQNFGAPIQITSALNISLEWTAFLTSIAVLWKTRDAASLFQHHPSNLLLTIPIVTIILPAFLSYPIALPPTLIIPHLVFLGIIALSILSDLKQIPKLHIRKS